MRSLVLGCLLFALLAHAAPGQAQPVQTQAEALADDAEQYAAQFGVGEDEALRRLKAQQASVGATDEIAREFTDRLAGISIAHSPDYHIDVLLTDLDHGQGTSVHARRQRRAGVQR